MNNTYIVEHIQQIDAMEIWKKSKKILQATMKVKTKPMIQSRSDAHKF